ncbi:putative F-box protein At1g60370 isoform X2 [Macadamia integrifolia]|uniref:putative F-box protein At1g60370 isoform X2 n=1 Tax=Macadamia integrifolia TaxID=60698 RepID=UPI001C4EE1DD|nr:putative F-box protein At1g60370 isoform X2 [Macadamia integrifolia]
MEEIRDTTIRTTTTKKKTKNPNTHTAGKDALIMNLPHAIIYEMLSRLPIESLIRCMSVCKLWSTFRYDSYFNDLHLTKSIILRPPTLVLGSDEKMSSLLMLSPNEEGGDWEARQIPIDFELLGSCFGSCNGILCIAAREGLDPIFLCNPFTREEMMLPRSLLGFPPSYSSLETRVGFGFDRLSNKYKVVRVYYYDTGDEDEYKEKVGYCEIITVGESSWRKLEFPTFPKDHYVRHPELLDGTLYWFISNGDFELENSDFIIVLDIGNEKFWNINCPPPRESIEFPIRESLIHMDGSLAIVDYDNTHSWSIDIWLLEGNKTKGFSFNLTTYDMSEVGCWGIEFSVMAKYDHDTFLIMVSKGFDDVEYSLRLFSPIEKKQYLCIQLGFSKSDILLQNWMVPTLKSLKDLGS